MLERGKWVDRYSLLSTWVKSPRLRGKRLIIMATCLPHVSLEIFREVSKKGEILFACPEMDGQPHYGKLASMIKSSDIEELYIYSIDGSPHCLLLHASANEAEYILGKRLNKRHYVIVNGKEVREISPDTVRIARYLHLVEELIRGKPQILTKLERYSLEKRSLGSP